MTFLTVLLALFIERVMQQHRPEREHRWFDAYCTRLTSAWFGRWLMSRPWGGVFALLPPLLLVAWLQAFFDGLGGLFAFAFGTVVLLYSLGPRDLGDETEAFLEARDKGEDARANALAQALCHGEAPREEPNRSFAVARAVVVLAATRLVGPIFWFVVLGAVGAAAYRAVHLFTGRMRRGDCPAEPRHSGNRMRHLVDWAPARLTAIGYAVAGSFDGVAQAWRTLKDASDEAPPDEATWLLERTGLAALDTFPDDAGDLAGAGEPGWADEPLPPVVEDALALVWRSLVVWMSVLGGGTLVAVLA